MYEQYHKLLKSHQLEVSQALAMLQKHVTNLKQEMWNPQEEAWTGFYMITASVMKELSALMTNALII